MPLDDCIDVRDCVLSGGAAGAAVLHFVFVTPLVEVALQGGRKGLPGLQAIPRGDAVAIADDDRPICGQHGNRGEHQENGDEKATLYVHMISVKVCKGRNASSGGCVRMKYGGGED